MNFFGNNCIANYFEFEAYFLVIRKWEKAFSLEKSNTNSAKTIMIGQAGVYTSGKTIHIERVNGLSNKKTRNN